jgi:hypothetical protein
MTPPAFDVRAFLESAGISPRAVRFAIGAIVFIHSKRGDRIVLGR